MLIEVRSRMAAMTAALATAAHAAALGDGGAAPAPGAGGIWGKAVWARGKRRFKGWERELRRRGDRRAKPRKR